jgi:hypothetical protein
LLFAAPADAIQLLIVLELAEIPIKVGVVCYHAANPLMHCAERWTIKDTLATVGFWLIAIEV